MVFIEVKINLGEFKGKICPYQLIHIGIYAISKEVTTETVRNWAKKGWIHLIEITGESTYVLSLDRRDSLPNDIHPKEWTIGQVAELLSVNPQTVRNWAKKGYIKIYTRRNLKNTISKEELHKFLFSKIKKYHA